MPRRLTHKSGPTLARTWVLAIWVLAICGPAFTQSVASEIAPDAANQRTESQHTESQCAESLRRLYAAPQADWPRADIDDGVAVIAFAPLPFSPPPDIRKAELGQHLFHDPRLSAGQDISCASCHAPASGWSIPKAVATGHEGAKGRRNPPGLRSVAARARLLHEDRHWGWDGRGNSLADQLLAPLIAPDEMANATLDAALARIAPSYEARFTPIYGGLSASALADALAAFLQTLEQRTRFDRFLAGDTDALDDSEIYGLHLFRTKARCANCHHGPLLSDGAFHNLRISSFGELAEDQGRARVSGRPEDTGKFRTPSLRHVGETAPYMHSGLFTRLEGVVNLYDRGGGEVWARNAHEAAHPLYPFAARLSPHIRPLHLSDAEKAALVSFLKTL